MPRQRDQEKFKKFYGHGQGGHRNFVALPLGRGGRHGVYISGYVEAAKMLLSEMLKEDHGNVLVYPVGHLLRHAIELLLKENLHQTKLLHGCDAVSTEQIWKTHDLQFLADHLTMAWANRQPPLDHHWTRIRQFLTEWEQADPNGSFLRYSRDAGGEPIPVDENINIIHLLEEAYNALPFLEGWQDQIQEDLSTKAEIESELRAEFEAEMRQYSEP